MSDGGGEDCGGGDDGGDCGHDSSYLSHGDDNTYHYNSKSSHLPSYEDAVNVSHDIKVSRNFSRTGDYVPGQKSYEVYDHTIFNKPVKNVERRNNKEKKSLPALADLRERQSSGPQPRSQGPSKCTICLIASFLILVLLFVMVFTLNIKWFTGQK